VTKVLDAVLEAITHWRDQRKRRKLEDQQRREKAAGATGRDRLAEQRAWADGFNQVSKMFVDGVTKIELEQLRTAQKAEQRKEETGE